MQQPSLGRIVIVTDPSIRGVNNNSDQAPAIVTAAHSEQLINCRLVADGPPGSGDHWYTSIQRQDVAPEGTPNWRWPERVG